MEIALPDSKNYGNQKTRNTDAAQHAQRGRMQRPGPAPLNSEFRQKAPITAKTAMTIQAVE